MTDNFVVRVVALALGGVVLGAVAAATLCAVLDKTLPDLVGDLAKVSLGSLGALLANTRSSDTATPVTVVNESTDAVPVETVPALKQAAGKVPAKRR